MNVNIAEGNCRKDFIMHRQPCHAGLGPMRAVAIESDPSARIEHIPKPFYAPQSGLEERFEEMRECFAHLCQASGNILSDAVFRQVEGLGLLLVTIQGTTDYAAAVAAVGLYLRDFCDESLISVGIRYLEQITIQPQDGAEDQDEAPISSWTNMMNSLTDNWALVKRNQLFAHLSRLLGLVVTMQLCSVADVTFNLGEYKIFEPCMKTIHGSAIDIIDAALSTVTFFVNTVSLCWQRKSLKPLLFNDHTALDMDEEYARIIAWWNLVKNGNLQKIAHMSDNEFDRRLENLTTQIRQLIATGSGFEKKVFQDKFTTLLNIKNDYVCLRMGSGIRRAPFALELFGESAQGKSTVGEQLLLAMLTSAGLPTDKTYQASYNAADKFMSTWSTDKLVLLVDDMANVKPEHTEVPPTRIIIDVCNNQPFYANMADLGQKGKVFIEPEILLVTTNVKDLDARVYSNCPYSVQRRMHVVITVRAKPEFQFKDKEGRPIGIDSTLVDAAYSNLENPPVFDDIWTLTLERAYMPNKLTSVAGYAPIVHNGKPLKDVDFRTAMNFILDKFNSHREAQQQILDRMRNRVKSCEKCPHPGCNQIKGMCLVHKDDDPKVCIECKETTETWSSFFKRLGESEKQDSLDMSQSSPEVELDDVLEKEDIKMMEQDQRFRDSCQQELDQENRLVLFASYHEYSPEEVRKELGLSPISTAFFLLVREYFKENDTGRLDTGFILDFETSQRLWLQAARLCLTAQHSKMINCDLASEDEIFAKDYLEEAGKLQSAPDHDNVVREQLYKLYLNEPHFGVEFGDNISEALIAASSLVANRAKKSTFGTNNSLGQIGAAAILASANNFSDKWDWLTLIPSQWLSNPRFLCIAQKFSAEQLESAHRAYVRCIGFVTVLFAFAAYATCLNCLTPVIFLLGFVWASKATSYVNDQFVKELSRRNSIAPMFASIRDQHMASVLKAGSIVGVLYAVASIYKAFKRHRPQGSLEPANFCEIEERDREENPWTGVSLRPLPVAVDARNTTAAQLEGLVQKNLVYGTIHKEDGDWAVNCLFLRSNVMVLPYHYFGDLETLKITCRKKNPTTSGGKFVTVVSKCASVHVPGTDLILCYSPSGGSFKDISRYLPVGELSQTEFLLQHRKKDGTILRVHGLGDPCVTGHSLAEFDGLRYSTLTQNTFRGMCGSVLTAVGKPLILGFHLGGQAGTPQGCAGTLTRDQTTDAVEALRNIPGVVISGTAEKFEEVVLGKRIIEGKKPHFKSPVNFQPHNSQVEFVGTCSGHTTFKSDARPTLITEHVMDVMDQPNVFCGPIESPQWKPWQTCLANMAIPALPYDPSLLAVAIEDYVSELVPLFESELWNNATPLTDLENWNGIPGKKFVDRIKLNTSIGFPLSGAKENFIIELEPIEPYSRVVKPTEEIANEIERVLDCYRRGERAYPIAKACKKDEILSKAKCRIFFGNAVALTYCVRKYYLPLLRVLQMNPLKSECAVGVNSHGPEWEQLHDFIVKHGMERLIGGDYGKYDQKLPSQLLFAAFDVLISFAKLCDYSDEDIRVMEAMTGDIVFAVINFNGDLITLTEGTHISGNSLTVILNGICGSLNMRCYFFSNNPASENFRDNVNLMTYGDDNIGSVSPDCHNFTIKGAAEFLGEYGQVYTMPDKESELVDFLPEDEFEFLKRKSVLIPEIGIHVGALIDKSCFKMLHYYLRTKGSPEERHACALNIDTACREWFNHGREKYELRRGQLSEVAKRAGISHLCTELSVDFDTAVERWKDKYGPQLERLNQSKQNKHPVSPMGFQSKVE